MSSPTFPIIVCRGDEYHSAGECFGGARDTASDVHSGLLTTLAAYGGMGGSDSVGTQWAAAYDSAAASALQASSKLVSTCARVRDLLAVGAYNHASGEADAHYDGPTAPPSPPTVGFDPCLATTVPSAAGGDSADPTGWPLIKQVTGLLWPNGHQDKLRAARNVWYAAATALDQATSPIPNAVGLLENQVSPEIPIAVAKSSETLGNFSDVQSAFRDLGDCCSEYAQYLDEAHHSVLEELRKMGEESAAWEAGMGILAPFTGGLSELGNGVLAERIAMYTARIGRFITELAGKVARLAGRITETITTKLGELVKKLAAWLEKAKTRLVRSGGDEPPRPGLPKKPSPVKPTAKDPKLQNLINNLYKGANSEDRVGDGTTADAVRNELQTLQQTGNHWHLVKAMETQRSLANWLMNRANTDPADRAVAIAELKNLMDALAGR
ncbi:hypothetical protein [Nocardia sp. NPDC051570]|uniref:WXG100-like domain-containing protein n=1 Tax=Nocardia sp. NPDC051570 TaxID=3364324 RepID=UPI0037B6912F